MTFSIVMQFVVVLAAIWMGARFSGVGLGLWGAVGLLVLKRSGSPSCARRSRLPRQAQSANA
jgi:anaerobic C4-dicarboxylate transporter